MRSKKADAAAVRQTGKRAAAAEPQQVVKIDQLAGGGGFSPDCSTVVSVFVVVSPSGVDVVVSEVVEVSFEHPVKPPTETSPAITTNDRNHFIIKPFN